MPHIQIKHKAKFLGGVSGIDTWMHNLKLDVKLCPKIEQYL